MTFTAISKSISWYLNYYCKFVSDWWLHISFAQYVAMMILSLFIGYYLMQRDANRTG